MKTKRRLAGRVWRMMTRSIPGHVIMALVTSLVCGAAAARFHAAVLPPYAAILGALVAYPVLVAAWWRFPRLGRSGR
jgi:predicted membrane protein